KLWRLETRDGQRLTARVFVSGMGGLHVPNMPAIPGIESFRGEAWHSAEWRDDIPLEGKRVAIIGAGASAIQIAPQIAPLVAQLDLYQRTPPYVLPKADPPTPAWLRALFKYFPPSQWLMRVLIYAINEARAPAFLDPLEGETLGMKFARRHRERQIADPVLREKATPQYRIGCKRVLVSDDYYPALCRENVALVTHAAARITPTGIVDSEGVERPADIILYATGFRPMDILSSVTITGEGGRRLNDEWAKHPEAYLATSVSGYPNFFTLLGPNSALGHNSVIYMIESQVRFVMDALRTLDAKGVAALDPKPEVQRAYNDDLQARLEKTVWGSGCTSWYLSEDGKNATLWPDYTFRFRARTKRVREADFDFVA
ncbi:MAG: flavin-containing monooxygenase, partial [Hyphomonadaceae bacterium]